MISRIPSISMLVFALSKFVFPLKPGNAVQKGQNVKQLGVTPNHSDRAQGPHIICW